MTSECIWATGQGFTEEYCAVFPSVTPTDFITFCSSIASASTVLRCLAPDMWHLAVLTRSGMALEVARPSHWGSTLWHKLRISDVMFGVALVAAIPSIDQQTSSQGSWSCSGVNVKPFRRSCTRFGSWKWFVFYLSRMPAQEFQWFQLKKVWV